MLNMKERLIEQLRGAGVGLLRIPRLSAVRAEPPITEASSRTPEHLAVALAFKKMGDAALRTSDLVQPSEHYVAAMRLYGDALACVAGVDVVRDGEGPTESPDSRVEDLIQNASAKHSLSAARIQVALQASVKELLAVAGAERRSLALAMQEICGAVIGDFTTVSVRAERRELDRIVQIIVAVLTTVGFTSLAVQYLHSRGDLANGKPWRASSELGKCLPLDKGGCPGRPAIYFHTKQEENPWIEYDLGKSTRFSQVIVENARDGFRERALPLIVEIGDDQQTWSEVARMTRTFESWSPAFPAVSARYVRFRVPRVSYLHLSKIQIRD